MNPIKCNRFSLAFILLLFSVAVGWTSEHEEPERAEHVVVSFQAADEPPPSSSEYTRVFESRRGKDRAFNSNDETSKTKSRTDCAIPRRRVRVVGVAVERRVFARSSVSLCLRVQSWASFLVAVG